MLRPHRVVIVGGGFGGLNATRALARAPVSVTLVDKRNFHLFQPLLYQVATGGLSPGNIAAPLRSILRKQQNVDVVLAEVMDFDVAGRQVVLADGVLEYDTLILAAGSQTGYFGNDRWAEDAPGLKTIEDAIEIRRRILMAFEAAERESNPALRRDWLTFVIIGGGPTGVELAGTLAEIAGYTLKHEFRHIDPHETRILLVDQAERILATYAPDLSASAAERLQRMGVTLQMQHRVLEIQRDEVRLQNQGAESVIRAKTILWAAGVAGNPLGKKLAAATGAEADRGNRVIVRADLSVPGHENIFVIGDLANRAGTDGKPLPGVAQVALQEGKYVARLIAARLKGQTLPPFEYRDLGNMATIGRSAAVAQLGSVKLRGYFAWVVWLFVHLINIVQFQSRVLVLIQWGWNYFTFSRSTRLITGKTLAIEQANPAKELPRPAKPAQPRELVAERG